MTADAATALAWLRDHRCATAGYLALQLRWDRRSLTHYSAYVRDTYRAERALSELVEAGAAERRSSAQGTRYVATPAP